MCLALVSVQLNVAAAGAAPLQVASLRVLDAGVHVSRPAEVDLTASGTTPSGSPTSGNSPGSRTNPGASAPRIVVGAALLLAAFFVLVRRRGQLRPPGTRGDEADPRRPETPAQGQPPEP